MKVTQKTKLDRRTPTYLKILEEARRFLMQFANPETRRDGQSTTSRRTFGNAPTYEAPSARAQDDPQECFRLGLTLALVVKEV
jgi:hypothetical protein